ncbi:MAG: carboxypeptidase regulatory-like domain-containing protein, partial [Terracidiphilus sp.]
MYSKLHSCTHFLIALALGASSATAAQAQAPAAPSTPPASTTVAAAQAAPVTTATFRGHVADPTGAVIPGATITITTPKGTTVKTVTADDTGRYAVNGLTPGAYQVQASVAGFAPFASRVIQLAAGQVMRVDIAMAMEVAQQSVVVTDESPSVNVEAGGNASAIVLKGKDLDALSDDPDELSNELTALAGPAAGPNGGQIYIDGFTGGQLPPKSAIREIRINQNPFSAEFDHIGYGRIEILTKPGTDVLHGRVFG